MERKYKQSGNQFQLTIAGLFQFVYDGFSDR